MKIKQLNDRDLQDCMYKDWVQVINADLLERLVYTVNDEIRTPLDLASILVGVISDWEEE